MSPGSRTSDGLSISMSIPSKPYSDMICVTEFTKFGMFAGFDQREVLSAAAERDQDLLSLALQPRDVVFHLRQIEARPHMQLHCALCRLMIHVGKRHDDHIPLRRHIAQPEYRSFWSAPRPVPDQLCPFLVPVAGAAATADGGAGCGIAPGTGGWFGGQGVAAARRMAASGKLYGASMAVYQRRRATLATCHAEPRACTTVAGPAGRALRILVCNGLANV